jgi:hypothetical protein
VDCLEDGDEVLLTQFVDVVAHYQFQASEPSGNYLLLITLWGLADGDDEDAPSIILNLHPTCLDDLLNTLQSLDLVALLLGLQLVTIGSEDGVLPNCA